MEKEKRGERERGEERRKIKRRREEKDKEERREEKMGDVGKERELWRKRSEEIEERRN